MTTFQRQLNVTQLITEGTKHRILHFFTLIFLNKMSNVKRNILPLKRIPDIFPFTRENTFATGKTSL